MKAYRWAIPLLLAVTIIVSGCCGGTQNGTAPSLQPSPEGLSLPAARSFYMGFTPTPYDYSDQAVRDTYAMLGEHSDIVLHHFDQGVPWPEALNGSPYDKKTEDDLSYRVSQLKSGQKVYLAVTPIAFNRDRLAPYWGAEGNMEMPGSWKGKDFDDPRVIEAYTNYCRYMIKKFHPDYFAYGIEVNLLAQKDTAGYDKFVALASKVYPVLKQENPGLPIFLSFHIDTYAAEPEKQRSAIQKALPYTDYMAVSTYPYTYKQDPEQLPVDWFSQMHALAPDKPFAVAETGFMAEDLSMPKYGASLKGNEAWQAGYVKRLLGSANDLDARFVIWFVPGDYDALWNKLQAGGADELMKMWKDCGLVDEGRHPRPGLGVWDAWLKLQKMADS